MLLADAVALVHGAAVLLMLSGALLALRWQRVRYAHTPVALGILAVNLAGAPCPLTELELALRAGAGQPGYPGGFLSHYVFQPLGLEMHNATVQIGIYTVALLPNVVGYGLLAVRGVRAPTRPPVDASPGTTLGPGERPEVLSRTSVPAPGRRPRVPRSRTPGPPAAAHHAGPRTS